MSVVIVDPIGTEREGVIGLSWTENFASKENI